MLDKLQKSMCTFTSRNKLLQIHQTIFTDNVSYKCIKMYNYPIYSINFSFIIHTSKWYFKK